MLLFLQQLFALSPQGFTLITVLNGRKVLLRGKEKPTGQYQSTTEQHREAFDGARVTLVADF
jgi:hypothetical protein